MTWYAVKKPDGSEEFAFRVNGAGKRPEGYAAAATIVELPRKPRDFESWDWAAGQFAINETARTEDDEERALRGLSRRLLLVEIRRRFLAAIDARVTPLEAKVAALEAEVTALKATPPA